MMRSSTGGEITTEQLRPFEGLVFSTARMFARWVGREEDDLAQELRIVVWRAVRAYGSPDPRRGAITVERYVFGAVANKIRDYKRDAAREKQRLDKHGIAFYHIEDYRGAGADGDRAEAFAGRYHFVERDDVYRRIDEGRLVLPATVTSAEARVLVMLMMGVAKADIMLRLRITRFRFDASVRSLQEKFADWAPARSQPDSSRVVEFAELRGEVAAAA